MQMTHWQQPTYTEEDHRLIAHIEFEDVRWPRGFPGGAEDVRKSIFKAGFAAPVGVKMLVDSTGRNVRMSGFVKFKTRTDASAFCMKCKKGISLNGYFCTVEPHQFADAPPSGVGTGGKGPLRGPIAQHGSSLEADPNWTQDSRTVCLHDLPTGSIVNLSSFRNEFMYNRIPIHSVKLLKTSTGGYKSFAFVTFLDEATASHFLKAGTMRLYGKSVRVLPAKGGEEGDDAPQLQPGFTSNGQPFPRNPPEATAHPGFTQWPQQPGLPSPQGHTSMPTMPSMHSPSLQGQIPSVPGGVQSTYGLVSSEIRRTVTLSNIPCRKDIPIDPRTVEQQLFGVWRNQLQGLPLPQRIEFLVDRRTELLTGQANVIMATEADVDLLTAIRHIELGGSVVPIRRPEGFPQASQSPMMRKHEPVQQAGTANHQLLPPTAPALPARPMPTQQRAHSASLSHNRRAEAPANDPRPELLPKGSPLQPQGSPVVWRREVDLAPTPPQGTPTFSVLTWNILFQFYTNSHTDYCPERQLAWSWRVQQMEKIIRYSDADVVALQEVVDGPEWAELEKILKGMGYESRRLGKYVSGKPNVDGLSLSFKTSAFQVQSGADELCTRLLSSEPQAGLAVCATHRQSGQRVVFATTHLKAPKLEEEVRQKQMGSFLNEIASRWFPHGPGQRDVPSLILCGDFNSQPHWGLVSRLSRPGNERVGDLGEVYLDAPREKAFEGKQYTCFMPFTQDQLDYIFYSKRELQPVSLWQVPSDLEVVKLYQEDKRTYGRAPVPSSGVQREFEMLPTPSFPSDHLPLFARFATVGSPNVDSTYDLL